MKMLVAAMSKLPRIATVTKSASTRAVCSLRGRPVTGRVSQPGWLESTARLAGDVVVLTPSDFDEIHCLDLVTGRRLWKQQHQDRRYVAAADSERIVIVCNSRIEALDPQTGELLWETSLGDELVAATGLKATTVRTARDALVAESRVTRDGAGRKGDPYRYSLAATFPAGPISKGYRSAGKNSEPAGPLVESAFEVFADMQPEGSA